MSKFRQPSVMSAQKRFSQVPSANIPRSKFDRSHAHKTTFDAGLLIPVYVDEVLPGDSFHMKSTALARLATPLHPIMDNMYLDTHYFFVPYRLVWRHWQEFMGERKSPTDDPNDFSVPQVEITIPPTDSGALPIWTYFGLPRIGQFASTLSVSALPFRAYNLIWNEWYRDQNLQSPVTNYDDDGPEIGTDYSILRRGKRKDYFTGALPWPQKGDPVTIPLGTEADVYGFDFVSGPVNDMFMNFNEDTSNLRTAATGSDQDNGNVEWFGDSQPGSERLYFNYEDPIAYADLQNATGVTINDLRTAFQIQKLLERDARGGTRYIELIQSHFGVTSDDARLQRPEYLGGSTVRVNVHPVASTVATGEAPQANLAAYGTSVGDAKFSKSFTEHGVIIGLVSARADLTYQRGVERFWSRQTRYDFYWPALAHLGEQAILNKEINYRGSAGQDNLVFGYQERYAEYRYKPSRITGLFNSDASASLDVWHLAQDFSVSAPVSLNSSFIVEQPPVDRVVAVPTEPDFICDIWFDLKCDRPMPVYSVPGLIDHF